MPKLTRDEERLISSRYESGESPQAIADEYDIHRKTVREIARRNGVEIRKPGQFTRTPEQIAHMSDTTKRLIAEGRITNNKKDLTGQTFGYLTVLEVADERSPEGGLIWVCQCRCGDIIRAKSGNLRTGNTNSCGCYNDQLRRERSGENNPNWQGTNVTRPTISDWLSYWKPRSRTCTLCGNEYVGGGYVLRDGAPDKSRNLNDYYEVCFRCHPTFGMPERMEMGKLMWPVMQTPEAKINRRIKLQNRKISPDARRRLSRSLQETFSDSDRRAIEQLTRWENER